MGTPDGDADDDGWSREHHGIDPAGVPFLRGWLRVVDVAAAPLVALRVPPDAVTAAGLAASLLVPGLAARGWRAAAVGAVGVSVLLDGLDGAVAVRTGRVSGYGRALDSACDRIAELAWGRTLVATAGMGRGQIAVIGGLTLGMEGWRARTGRHGVITVWERPSRTILTVVGLAVPGRRVTGWVGVGLASAAVLQLSRAGEARGLSRAHDPSTAARRAGDRGGSPG